MRFTKGYTPWNKGIEHIAIKGSRNHNWKGGKPICNCGKQLIAYTAKMCLSCASKARIPTEKMRVNMRRIAWKGGISNKDVIARQKFQQTIQKQVFERDNHTCQLCRQKGGILQVDHIQSWADYVELRFSIDNCRTLCMVCHYKITFNKPMPPTIKTWGRNLIRRTH